jgi:hypothetical protein
VLVVFGRTWEEAVERCGLLARGARWCIIGAGETEGDEIGDTTGELIELIVDAGNGCIVDDTRPWECAGGAAVVRFGSWDCGGRDDVEGKTDGNAANPCSPCTPALPGRGVGSPGWFCILSPPAVKSAAEAAALSPASLDSTLIVCRLPFSSAALRLRQKTSKAPAMKATNAMSPTIKPAVSAEVNDLCFEAVEVAALAELVVLELDLFDLVDEDEAVDDSVVSGCEKDKTNCMLSSVQKAEVTCISVQYKKPHFAAPAPVLCNCQDTGALAMTEGSLTTKAQRPLLQVHQEV